LTNDKVSLDNILSDILSPEAGVYSIAAKDLNTGRRWMINPRRQPSASLIKIFIMIEAFRQYAHGTLTLNQEQPIRTCDQVGGAGPLEHALPGTMVTYQKLIELMITESDNTATNILINKLSMNAINATIQRLDCPDTLLQRKMMDFASAAQGYENYTSVTDILRVFEQLYNHSCLIPELDETMLTILKGQQDRCKIPLGLPPGTVAAHKTGELDGIEHDAGIIYGPNCHFIAVFMTENLPDAERGQTIIAKLTQTIYQYLHTLD